MTHSSHQDCPVAPRTAVGRMLAAVDRMPGLGGSRTHVVFLTLFFLFSLGLYLVVLKVRGPAGDRLLTLTAWDAAFPFTPGWVWVYLLPYAVGPLLTVLLSRTTFEWYVRRAVLVVVVSLAIFVAVPTQTVRPLRADPANEARLKDDLTGWAYRRMVAVDEPPANAAPSLHVSLSCLLAWAMVYEWPRWWPAAIAAAVLVWLSTLYTAQHHLIDVVTGVLLASLAALGGPRRGEPPILSVSARMISRGPQ